MTFSLKFKHFLYQLNYNIFIFGTLILFYQSSYAKDYFVHPIKGSDTNSGVSKEQAIKTLKRASEINFKPGDRLLLATGQTYENELLLVEKNGTSNNPITITSISWDLDKTYEFATINFKNSPNGILIKNSSFIIISNIKLTASSYANPSKKTKMHCAILIENTTSNLIQHILIEKIIINNVFFESAGFKRGSNEIKTANGTQNYGWGIRLINYSNGIIDSVKIKNCTISDVSHTGIKLTGTNKNITNVNILDNNIKHTGGPGIQMSDVKSVYVANNVVLSSGSNNDSRKWGRGSGLWTWSSSNVLIEKNKFLYANGPADSAGAHIDFNCDNIIIQYNLSAYNAGGFCEILGNNYNCSYRYNISINDGYRVKGVNGAFQEGKVFWLSGYQGKNKERKGPVNTYFYNNTIYCDNSITPKIAIDNTSNGVLIANNIFYFKKNSKAVIGDQYKPDVLSNNSLKNVFFENNLFLKKKNWSKNISINDKFPIIGDPKFVNKGGLNAQDYFPTNIKLVKSKGIAIPQLEQDTLSLIQKVVLTTDILGNKLSNIPSLGAIEPLE